MTKAAGVSLLLAVLLQVAVAQENNGRFVHNVTFITIPVVALILFIIMGAVGIYLIYRARRGSFCCIEPKMRYHPGYTSGKEEASLPEYKDGLPLNEAPPAYEDAHQDKLTNEMDTTDSTPLNP